LGKFFRSELKKIAYENKIKININGLLAIPIFSIQNDKKNIYKTFITQEMLKNGFIINNAVYISTAHSEKIFKKFFKVLKLIFKKIKRHNSEKKIKELLNGKESISSFKRLNLDN
jgi:glutamate-1-semialdehyde aminotransferase